MFVRKILLSLVVAAGGGCVDGGIDLGAVNQLKPPAAEELKEPEDDGKVAGVGLTAVASGTIERRAGKHVYVLVNPLSNPATQNVWWVQQPVTRQGETFRSVCQFGEAAQGDGEYFAIVAVVTERKFAAGEKLEGIPVSQLYSRPTVVKRTP